MVNAMMLNEFPVTKAQRPVNGPAQDAQLKSACRDFESIFLNYILKSARNALPENQLFENTSESKMYKSMMDEKLAVSMARGQGAGLAPILYEELSESLPSSDRNGTSAKSDFNR